MDYTLSSYIRKGYALNPSYRQAFGAYSDRDMSKQTVACCAMGAAALGAGMPNEMLGDFDQVEAWIEWELPLKRDDKMRCPNPKCKYTHDLVNIVIHLNDDHAMQWGEIVEWLEANGL